MGSNRLEDYYSSEIKSILTKYDQFEKLLPSKKIKGSCHPAEEGIYVEALIRTCLKRFLPKALEVSAGFILRPAVKTGVSGKERKKQNDKNSGQIDILIYDSTNFPVFSRFEDNIIVPPEGVIAIISVKKTLRNDNIKTECKKLLVASKLCQCLSQDNKAIRGPFLALVATKSDINISKGNIYDKIFNNIKGVYSNSSKPTFDNLIGYLGVFDSWGIFKKRPANETNIKEAEYILFQHTKNENHLGLQFILTGLLSVFYDPTRNTQRRPGFTAFPSNRSHDRCLGSIPVSKLR